MPKTLLIIVRTWIATCLQVAVATALLSGCDHRSTDTPTVSIQKASPSGEQVLVGGESLAFDVEVIAHHVPAGSVCALNIQAADGTVLGVDGPKPIRDGESVTFHLEIKVPSTTSLEINTPLFFEGKEETTVLDSRQYKVVGRIVSK